MMRITVKKSDTKINILAIGHAEYSSAGTDIVCAGISTLLLSFVFYCQKQSIYIDAKGEPGFMEINIPDYRLCEECLEMLRVGLQNIAQQYPENLLLEWAELNF